MKSFKKGYKEIKDIFISSKVVNVKGVLYSEYLVNMSGEVFHKYVKVAPHLSHNQGYFYIMLKDPVSGDGYEVRRDVIVLDSYAGRPLGAIRIDHIDGDLHNDALSNLRWYTVNDVLVEYHTKGIIPSVNIAKIPEVWKPLELDYPCKIEFMVSNRGRIKFKNTGSIKNTFDSKGYRVMYYVDTIDSSTRIQSVHRAVAKAFIPNPNNYDIINHLDGDKTNNNIWNLEWCDNSMNQSHSSINAVHKFINYKDEQIHEVCKMLAEDVHKHSYIGLINNVDEKTVSAIRTGRRFQRISSQYQFEQKRWTKKTHDAIISLYEAGYAGKALRDKAGIGHDQAAISYYERVIRKYNRAHQNKALEQISK